VRSDLTRVDQLDWTRVDRVIGDLESEGLTALGESGCAAPDVTILVGADMRYVGQQHEVTIIFDIDPRQSRDAAALTAQFEAAYRTLYGVNPSHVPIELVTWRVVARGPLPHFDGQPRAQIAAGAPKRHRPVHAWEDGQSVPVYERSSLATGQTIAGPAIIEERETTTALPPGWSATIDALGCIVATKG
jgi:N-methylhydantoinase A